MTDQPTAAADDIVTAVDVLEAQAELEKDAAEILPGRFDECTVALGPKRQSAYACLTCSPDEPRGLCYACSIACHADHQLVELFERRRFLCDCGLGRIGTTTCRLQSSAAVAEDIKQTTVRNRYDHNYLGRFCRCQGTYDPDQENGTMYQCAVCEDWFHDRCLTGMPADTDTFAEVCCRECATRLPFLAHYAIATPRADTTEATADSATAESGAPKSAEKQPDEQQLAKDTEPAATTAIETNGKRTREPSPPTAVDDQCDATATKRIRISQADGYWCCRAVTTRQPPLHDLFMEETWRQRLCRCDQCQSVYEHEDVAYLLADEDAYEPEKDDDIGASIFELGLQQLMRMDRDRAINGMLAYDSFKNDIKSFLHTFAASGQVVTKADVDSYFAEKQHARQG